VAEPSRWRKESFSKESENIGTLRVITLKVLSLFRKKLRRAQVLEFFTSQPPCTVAMEACGGAHYWGREIGKLGHAIRLIAPTFFIRPVSVKRFQTISASNV
jgi:transposase